MQIRSVKLWLVQKLEGSILYKFGFPLMFVFERYFEVREHQHQTQHERIPLGSYPYIFRQVGSPNSSLEPWEPRLGSPVLGAPLGVPPGSPVLGALRAILWRLRGILDRTCSLSATVLATRGVPAFGLLAA